MAERIIAGTRRSRLAQWQTQHVIGLLQAAHPHLEIDVELITTQGDVILDKPLPSIGGKGLFTEALEQALRDHDIDLAVHSLKDLPTEHPADLTIGAVPERANVHDVLVSRSGQTLDNLPADATVGTSSRRRAAQLRAYRPDLTVLDIRGNVPTRLEKALNPDGPYAAIVLAQAGLERLGLDEHITQVLALDIMLPAPGQGALAVQCRATEKSLALLAPLNHFPTCLTTTAERAFLNRLEGGCSMPVGALATLEDDTLKLRGRVLAADGSSRVEQQAAVRLVPGSESEQAAALGRELAEGCLQAGASVLLEVLQ